MRQYKLPKELFMWDHVSVVWEDAYSHPGATKAETFVDSFKPCIRRISGYVLAYDHGHIIIAQSDDRNSNTDDDCEDITVVPRGMIRRIYKSRHA